MDKKPRRRRRKADRSESMAETPAAKEGASDVDSIDPKMRHSKFQEEEPNQCSVCGLTFTSRTKMFQHIRSSGHAILRAWKPCLNLMEFSSD